MIKINRKIPSNVSFYYKRRKSAETSLGSIKRGRIDGHQGSRRVVRVTVDEDGAPMISEVAATDATVVCYSFVFPAPPFYFASECRDE